MKRLIICLVFVIAFSVGITPTARADTNNFQFASFEADYYLSKDTEGRSRMEVKERLIAEFPNFNQNHGIERAIPKEYDGHPVNLDIVSITNDTGQSLTYQTSGNNSNEVVRIGDTDTYVHGQQTYNITYTLRDVTKNFSTGDELYWDTNGTDWQQPFSVVTARLHIPADLQNSFDRRTTCYAGPVGSSNTKSCTVTTTTEGEEMVITATTNRRLNATENLTFVAGFSKGTFKEYVKPPMPLWQKLSYRLRLLLEHSGILSCRYTP